MVSGQMGDFLYMEVRFCQRISGNPDEFLELIRIVVIYENLFCN